MNPVHRIIDANANRAREALRVMEDAARFALDDPGLSAGLKGLRHDFRAALEAVGVERGLLLASRDTPGDVGTEISTRAEADRAGLAGVAAAAGARLTEALRSIEESLKAMGADARPVERLRYRAYDLDRSLGLALGTGRGRQWSLCVLVTESLCTHHPWDRVARLAVLGGADCLQLREKGLPDGELLRRARELVRTGREGGAAVVINDRPDIALLAGADGVHVGQEDLPVEEVRRIAGFRLLVGVSTATVEQARAAVRAGADYCGVGPMFPTTTKEKPVISGPAYLRAYLADSVSNACPHLAIGGITAANVRELTDVGVRGIAVSSAVCSAEDPEAACRELLAGLRPRG